MRQVFLDTETTGLSVEGGDRLIEIGCIEMIGRRLTGHNLHLYVNPQRPSSEEAFKVHGISDEFLADKPLFADVAEQVLAFVAGAEVIIHNAPFDVGFIDSELQRAGHAGLRSRAALVTDSLLMARELFPGKSNSLDALCRRLEVDNTQRTWHGALLDASLLAEVYIRMTRGQDSLVIDGDAAAATSDAFDDAPAIDLREFNLLAVAVSHEEHAAHEAVLLDLDKASGGQTVWRRVA